MGLRTFFRRTKPGRPAVAGTAQVVSVAGFVPESVYQRCELQLVVSAPGLAPTAVEHRSTVHRSKWPAPGATLPVSVDPADPAGRGGLAVRWDEVPAARDLRRAEAEAAAEAMRRAEGGS
ncbi:hypothetical protein GUY44_24015 [Pimelobacter simplex]|uniref:Uncharacterized protein n=1 Tax=Nocardioides simplex TaxID=2045 RepID=A0A0A1DNP2_NOCSI|nr:hypothetical protein [Pimelobacter simplex]AIY18178.1 hypothetical protein KR76_17890 [Pimelobacter simplex]MCG8153566.1 hypothetical protein [Pimelobacter simplex]SFN10523.1 hypothetical protein SAMN05421671_5174 [Pimelobacter simplex]